MFNRFLKSRNSKKGFTLIELMVVVAIIAVLAAIAIPAYISYKRDSQMEVARTSLAAVIDSMNGYSTIRHGKIGILDSNGNIQGTVQNAVDKLAAEGLHVTIDSIKLDAPMSTYCRYDDASECFMLRDDVSKDLWVALYDDGAAYTA